MITKPKQIVGNLLGKAGIEINGKMPWDIQVHDDRFYLRILTGGSLALGESYMDGWWDAEQPDEFICRVLKADLHKKVISPAKVAGVVLSSITNRQSLRKARGSAERHYNIGNDFYGKMLDPQWQYTCGYWKGAGNLDQAQENKLELICRKLRLEPGESVLELGSGWGYLARYMAQKYGCRVTAYNVSSEQVKHSKKINKGLPVKIVHKDYRLAEGQFDKVVSIGLAEHVGPKNYRKMMETAHRCLKENGLYLLHTIGRDKSGTSIDPWIDTYVFPNAVLPSVKQLSASAEGLFVMEDWHNFGPDYDRTLMAWHENFRKSWPEFKKRYGERFERMWSYYLLCCAGSFRARHNQLWQIVFSKGGYPGGYESIR